MKKSFVVVAGCSCLFLSGCASWFNAREATWPWIKDANLCAAETCTGPETLRAYLQANSYCREVQNYYEGGGQKASSNKFAVGAVGTLAGIASPISSGDTAAGLAGLSGATNALQTSLDETFSASVSVKRRKAVAKAVTDGANKFNAANNANAKVQAAVDMATNCSMASATADSETLKALSSDASPEADPLAASRAGTAAGSAGPPAVAGAARTPAGH